MWQRFKKQNSFCSYFGAGRDTESSFPLIPNIVCLARQFARQAAGTNNLAVSTALVF